MRNVSDFVIDRLIAWDLHQWYGYPGDGIGGFDGALVRAERAGKDFRYIRPTHEEIAAWMACAHAKFTGEVGVCVATSGPGAIHLLNGLYDAKMDNQPVVAVVGQQGRVSIGSETQQELDLERVFQDVAGFVETVTTPMQAQMVVDRAVRVAQAQRTPTVVVLPADVQRMAMAEPDREHWVSRTGVGYPSTELLPPSEEVERAARVLNAATKVAMIVGQGARGATDEVIAVADRLGAGITTTLLGKDVVPGDLPYNCEQLGLLGSRASYNMMQECDSLLMVGSNFPYGEFLPPTGQARGVQIDLDPAHLSGRYPMEVNLLGDVKVTLAALLDRLERVEDRSWQNHVIDDMRAWNEVCDHQAATSADPVNPRYVYQQLNQRLPDDAVVTCDAGSTADWYANHIRLGRGMRGNTSGRLASMLGSMPYAVAAKFAHPGRPVVCTIGDGAFQMLGMNELLTVKRHWRSWEDPRFIVMVLHNNDLTQVSWEMREAGDPRYNTSQIVEDMNYADYATLLGFDGIRVDRPDDVADAWDRAFAADRPTLLDVRTDPDVPPLPPHITYSQAKDVALSVARRDPAAGQVVENGARAIAAELFATARHALHRD
ncbi:thiamine pyrophosphate-requiring protein [Streptomyces reniochalinae]|uniref:Thiamine pyrophosphate-requiring protein n=1 Tax=Streptomyces reniochalinae TaxID=2250578 RepID=A0A367E7T2_9ACTN|nr:thiamine pyrophosphate-requiring protein [Streptomyces reniochalinae]RCG13812.1 thiamine pyrophosphate-requiring protein [Streptomyces reniochalinae]